MDRGTPGKHGIRQLLVILYDEASRIAGLDGRLWHGAYTLPRDLDRITKEAVLLHKCSAFGDDGYPGWRGRPFVQNEEAFCLVRFDGTAFQNLGPPNDEELVRHVLHAKGLRPYGAYEVLASSLVAQGWRTIAPAIALRISSLPSKTAASNALRATATLRASCGG
jgi:hypothetical protein